MGNIRPKEGEKEKDKKDDNQNYGVITQSKFNLN